MLRQNVGRLDRILRLVVGIALIPIGLVALGGGQGNIVGILVTAAAALPILTGLTGFCPGYVPFGISTLGRKDNPPSTLTA